MRSYIRALSTRAEFAIVVLGAFGIFIVGSLSALAYPAPIPPISNDHLKYLLIHEPLVLVTLLAFLHIRDWDLARLGLRFRLHDASAGIGIVLLAEIVYIASYWIAFKLLEVEYHGPPVLVGAGISPLVAVMASIVNPVFEEVFVSGYIITGLKDRQGYWTAINTSVAIRLLYHLYQGSLALVAVVPVGLIFAHWYGRTGRLWPIIIAHMILDFGSLVMFVAW